MLYSIFRGGGLWLPARGGSLVGLRDPQACARRAARDSSSGEVPLALPPLSLSLPLSLAPSLLLAPSFCLPLSRPLLPLPAPLSAFLFCWSFCLRCVFFCVALVASARRELVAVAWGTLPNRVIAVDLKPAQWGQVPS